jgi:hypothetical protein
MNEKLDILQMLHDDKISVDEASKLLEAISCVDENRASADQSTRPSAIPPDMERLRRLSFIPFAVSMALLALAGGGAYALYLRTEGRITFWFVLLLALVILTLLATVLTLRATMVPWLHVRIQSAPGGGSAGRRFAISLPVPLTLAGWALGIARRFVDRDIAGHLGAAATLIATMRDHLGKPGMEPIVVDVDDEDERVQVYIG